MINADKVIIQSYFENNEGNIINDINEININNKNEGNTLNIMYLPELGNVLDHLQQTCDVEEGNKYIQDIRYEFNSEKPNVGRIQAAFNMLKRVCSNKKFLDAVTVFGNLLVKAVK